MAKILLVEDDNNLREIYQARLAAEGYDIVVAQDGEEALVVAKQNKPDLIVSDVMMPRISGFEMLDILRNTDELKQTKVIMLTALGQAEDQSRADNLGADKYLVKSQVTLEDIVNAAKELLGETASQPNPVSAAVTVSDPTPQAASVPLAEPTPQSDPQPAQVPVATEPVQTPPAPSVPVTDPSAVAPDTTLPPVIPVPAPAAAGTEPEPVPEPAVPASVVPQPDTTVVVPPAPADPTPPVVTVAGVPPVPPADGQAAPMPNPSVIAPATATAASQTLASEEASVQAQIDSFANQSDVTPPLEVAPAPANDQASNDAALTSAVDQLNALDSPPAETSSPLASQPAEQQPTAAPAPEEPATPSSIGGTKVIQPLNAVSTSGPNLEELLAKEEARVAAEQATGSTSQSAIPAPGTTNPNSQDTIDPNSIAL